MTTLKPETGWAAYNKWGRRVFGPFKYRDQLRQAMSRYHYNADETAAFSIRRVTITPDPESESEKSHE